MTSVRAEVVRRGVVDQAFRFVVFGVISAGVDFGVYNLFLHIGTWADLAKAISFCFGTVTAYLLNRRWTFDSDGGAAPATRFAALYCVTFFVNVGVNALGLHALPDLSWRVPVAWVIAQGVSTIINFVMLRTVVFRDSGRPVTAEIAGATLLDIPALDTPLTEPAAED